MTSDTRRRLLSRFITWCCGGAVVLILVPLGLVLFFVISQGVGALNLDFFTHMPQPVGEPGGGMANAIFGTLVVTGLGALFAIPVGVMSGKSPMNSSCSLTSPVSLTMSSTLTRSGAA